MPVPVPPGYDLTNPDIHAQRVPLDEYAWLRHTAPVFWNEQTVEESSFDDGGLWVLSRHEDVKAVSCARTGWSSEENTAIPKFDGKTIGYQERQIQTHMMLNMDEPRHTRVRGVVSRGVFTPRGVAGLEDALRARAERIVLDARDKGSGDFVTDIACELPLQAIADLVGFPQEDRKKIFGWSNEMMAYDDPDYDVDPATAAAEILGYAAEMGEDRTAHPRDDIVTRLVAAADDEVLSSEEFAFFVLILAVAGNETTRNAIAHGMKLLTDHPDQRALWFDNFEATSRTAVDEIVRYATPVIHFRRTAVEDCHIGSTRIAAGDKVVMFYNSANRDETVFDDPYAFNVRRPLQPQHVGFGAGGPHFCLGANLARREIAVMFDEIRRRMPTLRISGEPDYLQSGFINGIKRLPCAWDPS